MAQNHSPGPDPKMAKMLKKLGMKAVPIPMEKLQNALMQQAVREGGGGLVGPAGQRLTPADEGPMQFRIAAHLQSRRVIFDFGEPRQWVGFDKEQAVFVAKTIFEKVLELQKAEDLEAEECPDCGSPEREMHIAVRDGEPQKCNHPWHDQVKEEASDEFQGDRDSTRDDAAAVHPSGGGAATDDGGGPAEPASGDTDPAGPERHGGGPMATDTRSPNQE